MVYYKLLRARDRILLGYFDFQEFSDFVSGYEYWYEFSHHSDFMGCLVHVYLVNC